MITPNFARSLLAVALVGLGYWAAAQLAVMLVLQPGYATAVWPSAGIALASVLIWGWRGAAGSALGALTFNLQRLLDWPGDDAVLRVTAQAVTVSVGATLQALAGAWLVRRAVGLPLTLLRDHHVIRFMVLAGPLASAISATFGTLALLSFGTLTIDQALFNWFVWWTGDSIGVLTAAPLVLIFFPEPADLWRSRRLSIGAPMVVTFGVAVGAFFISADIENRREAERLERRVDAINAAFRSRVQNAANLVRSCVGLFNSSGNITPQGFQAFCRSVLQEGSGVKALSSVVRVPGEERGAFEASMREAAVADFRIVDVAENLELVPSPRRSEHFVIAAIEPLEENRPALGVDISSRPESMAAMYRAVESADLAVTDRVRLVQEADGPWGVVMYLPRFKPGMALDTFEDRKAALFGLSGAVVQISDLVTTSTTRFDVQEMTLRLTDVTNPAQPQLLYSDQRTASPHKHETVERYVEIGGRRWQLSVSRLAGYSLANQSLQSWMVLAGGLALTSLLGGLLMILTGRATLIASLVRERTRELSTTNARLAEEQAVSQHMMRQLKASRDAAEEADRTKSTFLANMSHEIRTPMTAILGYADLLADPSLSPQVRDSHIEVIRRNGEHLLEIVNDILDISKIEAGKLSVELIPCSLDEIIRDVRHMMQTRAHAKGIEFSVHWKGDTSRLIRTDPIRLRQILINLVSNAIKFTERGSVAVRVERLYDTIEISVVDTGIGMSAEQIQRVFQPFTQGDSTMTRRFGGTGLGLAISRHLSRLLGGELTVQSELGRGSNFHLSVPATDVPDSEAARLTEPAAEGSAQPEAPLRGRRVLMAEDSNDVRDFLRHVLEQCGIDVTVVVNGEQLIDAALHAGNDAFDLLLIDMQMPLIDGYEAARRLRAAGITRPIIALTAHTLETDRTACLAAGCSDYIRKPVRGHELVARLAAALDSTRGQEVSRTREKGLTDPTDPTAAGDDSVIIDLLPVFFEEMDRSVATLRAAVEARQADEVRQVLHNVKGAAATFGFPQLGELAALAGAAMREAPWSPSFDAAITNFYAEAAEVQQRKLATRDGQR